jgi:hypothetical protein
VEDGWLSALELPGAATVYERAGKLHHIIISIATVAAGFSTDMSRRSR